MWILIAAIVLLWLFTLEATGDLSLLPKRAYQKYDGWAKRK